MEFKKPKYLFSLDISNGTICGDTFAREKNTNVYRIRGEFISFLVVKKNPFSIFLLQNPVDHHIRVRIRIDKPKIFVQYVLYIAMMRIYVFSIYKYFFYSLLHEDQIVV